MIASFYCNPKASTLVVDVVVQFADEQDQQTLTAREFFESAQLEEIFESKDVCVKMTIQAIWNRFKHLSTVKEKLRTDGDVQTKIKDRVEVVVEKPSTGDNSPSPLPPSGQRHPVVPLAVVPLAAVLSSDDVKREQKRIAAKNKREETKKQQELKSAATVVARKNAELSKVIQTSAVEIFASTTLRRSKRNMKEETGSI